MAIDPICGMTVSPDRAAGRYDYRGVTYYFCAVSCLETFKADPERALQAAPRHMITSIEKRSVPTVTAIPAPHGMSTVDPVCGMTVQPQSSAGSHVHAGKTYSFCSPACLAKFRDDPEHYLTPPPQRSGAPSP